MSKKHIICFSGGHSSGLVAIEAVRKYGAENVILLNHDINDRKEAADIKRFKADVAAYLGIPIIFANYGGIGDDALIPNQFDISVKKGGFKKPSSGDAFCTYELKTKPFQAFLAKYFPLNTEGKNHDCVIYYGFDDNEQARISRRSGILADAGYDSCYPLAHWPSTIEATEEVGIKRPNTYSVYKHGNCKGCLKGGIQHWYVTYCNEPETYQEGVDTEAHFASLGKPYSILKDQRFRPARPLYLSSLAPVFERMKADAVPQTEHYKRGKFIADLKRYRLLEDEASLGGLEETFETGIACECFSLNEEPEIPNFGERVVFLMLPVE